MTKTDQTNPSDKINVLWSRALLCLVVSITFITFLPALQNGFVNWDDNAYVYENQHIKTIDLQWIFTAYVVSNWHPLTVLSYVLDYAVWELDPWGYHLTNIILHTLNTLLVFFLISKLAREKTEKTSSVFIATITALLFGIHPLHVESVAWIAERKDVLCAFFFLSSILIYLHYSCSMHSKKKFMYSACLLLFIMALMSKPMAVSLPVVLLLIDFYPLERLSITQGTIGMKKIVGEKIPFFGLTVISALITISAQGSSGALKPLEEHSFLSRFMVASQATIAYLVKMIFPVNLVPFYPYPKSIDYFSIAYLGSVLLIVLIFSFCVRSLKKTKLFMTFWLYYLITLLPVIGIVQVGNQSMADRYTYLPSLSPFLLIGVGLSSAFILCSKKYYRLLFIILILISSGLMIQKTVTQVSIWKDSLTLWSHEINLFPDSDIAYSNRGIVFKDLGKDKEALADLTKAIEINPKKADYYFNRGDLYRKLKRVNLALADFTAAVTINPQDIESYSIRGVLYGMIGDYHQAIADFNTVIKQNPQHKDTYYNLGLAYSRLGDMEQARLYYTMAEKLN